MNHSYSSESTRPSEPLTEYKERVKRLRKAVSTVLGVPCSQSQAYELLAKEENYPHWDALSGVLKQQSSSLEKTPSQNSPRNITASPVSSIEASAVKGHGDNNLDPAPPPLQAKSESAIAPMKPLLSLRRQLIQLVLISNGLQSGTPIMDVIRILKEQRDPVLSQGWLKVTFANALPHSKSEITDIFAQTLFFHDDVLTLIEMGHKVSGNHLQGTLASAIDFLKDMIRDEEQWSMSANSMAGVRAHSDRLNVSLIKPVDAHTSTSPTGV